MARISGKTYPALLRSEMSASAVRSVLSALTSTTRAPCPRASRIFGTGQRRKAHHCATSILIECRAAVPPAPCGFDETLSISL